MSTVSVSTTVSPLRTSTVYVSGPEPTATFCCTGQAPLAAVVVNAGNPDVDGDVVHDESGTAMPSVTVLPTSNTLSTMGGPEVIVNVTPLAPRQANAMLT